jgi:hypothetical protein
MGAPITIKKRKVPVKKPATPAVPATPDDAGDDVAPETEEPVDTPVLLSKPKPTKGKGKGAGSSAANTVAAVLALIAVLLILFVLLLQWSEYSELNPLFPKPVPVGMITALIPW